MYFKLVRCYPRKEQYGDTLQLCRHCHILSWKVCVSEVVATHPQAQPLRASVLPHAFLLFHCCSPQVKAKERLMQALGRETFKDFHFLYPTVSAFPAAPPDSPISLCTGTHIPIALFSFCIIQGVLERGLFFWGWAFPGLRWRLSGRESICQCRRHEFDPWVREILWRRKWKPTPVFLPGESHEQRSLVGYSPWGRKRVRHDWVTEQRQQQFHRVPQANGMLWRMPT